MLSHVQNLILAQILKGNALRYSEIKPKDVDNDLFNYHLKFLLDKKYIKKENDLYYLTDFGKKYVLHLNSAGQLQEYFKISVVPILLRRVDGKIQILLQKRLRHPFYGDILFGVSGKVQPGEKVEDAAKRKLSEETGLESEFKFWGVHRKIRYDSRNQLIEDTLYHVCYSFECSGDLITSNDHGVHFWYDLNDAIELGKENITHSSYDQQIVDKINSDDFSIFYWVEEEHFQNF
jgi:8-oxo-dGTP pyrophosphatase MutT (NUDIX family)